MKLKDIELSDLIMDDFNDPEVRYQIALYYLNGTDGMPCCPEEGMCLMHSAANQGNYSAIKYLEEKAGPVTSGNLAQWCVWAERGDPEAMFRVAEYLAQHEIPGTAKDFFRYISTAAALGHKEALEMLVDGLDELYQDDLAQQILENDAHEEEEEWNPLDYNRNLAAVLAEQYAAGKSHRDFAKALFWRQIYYSVGGKTKAVSDEVAKLEQCWPDID